MKPPFPRSMFWRMWLRWLTIKRPQALLALVSLAVGAGIASMLLDLYGGARRKMTEEFRAYGANVVLAPAAGDTSPLAGDVTPLMDAAILSRLDALPSRLRGLRAAPVLDVVTSVSRASGSPLTGRPAEDAVAVGTNFAELRRLNPAWHVEEAPGRLASARCGVGTHLAQRLGLRLGDSIEIAPFGSGSGPGARKEDCRVLAIVTSGGSEDDQVFVPLDALQQLAGLEGKISLVEISVPGDAPTVAAAVTDLGRMLPEVEVRPIRQIVASEGKVLTTLRALLISMTALILIIVVLCVMSTVTVILLERRRDIAVMKSLGAASGLLSRLVLAEVATLGLIGGLAGFAAGALVAGDLGRRLFGATLLPAWWTLPVICAASVVVTMLSAALPLGTVRSIDPAVVLKGE